MRTLLIVTIFALVIIYIFIIKKVYLDRIVTGDYILWYTHNYKRESINISEKLREIII